MLPKKVIFFVTFCILVLLTGGFAYFWFTSGLQPVSPGSSSAKVSFVISSGESASSILARLQQASLIKSALFTKIHLKISKLDNIFRPGEYALSPDLSTREIIDRLSKGPSDIKITIPEGWRREQIAARVDSALVGSTKKFDAQAFIKNTVNLEGTLFPDTYFVPPSATTDYVISLLTSNFAKKTGLGVSASDREIVILASLVEREAKSDSDRRTVASIIKKRFQAGWNLQIDATVQYAVDSQKCRGRELICEWWKPIFDTKYPSLYNTYLNLGLPPSAICNPGQKAVDAIKNATDTPYWYYITGNDGVSRYAITLAEHNLNIDKYLLH